MVLSRRWNRLWRWRNHWNGGGSSSLLCPAAGLVLAILRDLFLLFSISIAFQLCQFCVEFGWKLGLWKAFKKHLMNCRELKICKFICHWPSHQLLTKALNVRRLSEASFW